MSTYIAFLLVFMVVAFLSGEALQRPRTHGFYRFFALELLVTLFFLNLEALVANPLSAAQIVSWILLALAIAFALPDSPRLARIRRERKLDAPRTNGFYRYVRYPLYTSLFFLDWCLLLKRPSWIGAALAAVATLALVVTARVEEGENLRRLGQPFVDYREKTKMFIPFVV